MPESGTGTGVYLGPMPRGGSGYTLWDLVARISDFLGMTSGATGATGPAGDDLDRVLRVIEDAYLQFLYPPTLPEESTKPSHVWSWMTPEDSLVLTAGNYAHDLPEDFAHMARPFSYAAGTGLAAMIQRGEGELMQRIADSDTAGVPRVFAVRPKRTATVIGQRFEVLVWPKPDVQRVVTFTCRLAPLPITQPIVSGTAVMEALGGEGAYRLLYDASADFTAEGLDEEDKVVISHTNAGADGIYTLAEVVDGTHLALTVGLDSNYTVAYRLFKENVYALGGQPHSATLLASCYEVAERTQNDEGSGPESKKWWERLRASIALDRNAAPRSLGFDGPTSFIPRSRIAGEIGYITE